VPVATFGNTNAFAAFAAPCLALAAGRAARAKAWPSLLAAALLAAALLLARSRGGWLAGAIGALVALLVAQRRELAWRRAGLAVAAGVGLGLLLELAAAQEGELASKPLGLGRERTSNLVRLDVARASLRLIGEHPLAGSGPGSFRDAYPRFRLEREARTPTREGAASEVDHPHDEWLRLLAEGGALTAGAMALAALAAALALSRAAKISRDDDGGGKAALAGAGAAWLAGSLPWSTLYDPSTALLGALLAGAALAGEIEVAASKPNERWLARGGTVLLLGLALVLAVPTLLAEAADWRAARDGRLDRADLDSLERAASLDRFTLERQYSVGLQFLAAARLATSGAAGASANASVADGELGRARDCFERALDLSPNHVASIEALAEVEARRGDVVRAKSLLGRARALEPWRPGAEEAAAALLMSLGQELAAARARLDAEGDAAVAPLFEEAKRMRAAGRVRPAAQVLDLIAPRAPEDGDLWRELALAWKDLGDDSEYRRAFRRSQVAYALAALADGRSEDARTNLGLARRDAPPGDTALEELLESCVDLQRARLDEARARLSTLDAAAVQLAVEQASPTARRFLKLLAAAPALRSEAERLGLER
jgi:O-antigen ligase